MGNERGGVITSCKWECTANRAGSERGGVATSCTGECAAKSDGL